MKVTKSGHGESSILHTWIAKQKNNISLHIWNDYCSQTSFGKHVADMMGRHLMSKLSRILLRTLHIFSTVTLTMVFFWKAASTFKHFLACLSTARFSHGAQILGAPWHLDLEDWRPGSWLVEPCLLNKHEQIQASHWISQVVVWHSNHHSSPSTCAKSKQQHTTTYS